GESGVEVFHSPAFGADMIAGFSAVQDAGWGVIVPQPLAELEAMAELVNRNTLLILFAGLGFSCAIALWISSKVARRVNRVEYAAMALASGDWRARVDESRSPITIREIANLISAFNRMAVGIERANVAEERLQKTQKMEALGQLTGGIAHDFNNLLQVIQGNAEILGGTRGTDLNLTGPILEATQLGGTLTHQLLAFSRLQPLRPEVVDPAEMVENFASLLGRTLGTGVEIDIEAPRDVWPIVADTNQLQNALLNLALNARDAMTGQGRILISCANRRMSIDAARAFEDFAPGDYVVISVSDQGVGMTAEVQARAFEPFFTTKEAGQGSGLGLSTVYGFAKQSGGHAALSSAPGQGTTISIYLGRARVPAEPRPIIPDVPVPRGNGEVVLVVEDMHGVRATSARLLRDLGYRVIAVADPGSALRILRSGGEIDVVLCDVVLPGEVSGPGFVRSARRIRPDLRVVFMTGYSADTDGVADAAASRDLLILKPFQKRDVARVLRDTIKDRADAEVVQVIRSVR
ncbi:MAG: ATP-binding protein, partial [Pseudomonadota bacterium]